MTTVREPNPGAVTIAGVEFERSSLEAVGLPEWTLLSASTLSPSVADGYRSSGFVTLLSTLGDENDIATISRWSLSSPEFGWPAAAGSCGCLGDPQLAETALELSGNELFRTPGALFDHFVISTALVDQLVGSARARGDGSLEITADAWLALVGLEQSWFALGHVDAGPRSTLFRDALANADDVWLRDSYLRGLDVHLHGGFAIKAADELRDAYIDRQLARQGFTFARPMNPGMVVRRVWVRNSVRMTESVCCTSRELIGRKVFMTDIERLADESTAASLGADPN